MLTPHSSVSSASGVRRGFLAPAAIALACLGTLALGASFARERQPTLERPLAPSSASANGRAAARALALAAPGQTAPVDLEIVKLQRVAGATSNQEDAWLLLGRAWVRKARETADAGYYLNANACAELLLELSPGNAHGRNLQALVLLNQHRFSEARDLARSILDGDAANVMAWGSLSDAALELGDDQAAFDAARAMMALKPNLPSYSRVSYLQWLRGDTQAALESIRLAIDAGGDRESTEPRAWALVQAALLFWHQGDYDGADAGFSQALEVVNGYAPALVGRGRVALAHGDAALAAKFFQRALDSNPLTETAGLLSEAQRLAGNLEAASAALRRAEAEGRRGDARALSLVYSSRRLDVDEALRLAEQDHRQRGNLYSDDALSWALYRAGRFEEARQAADRALRLGTKDARLLFHQGAIVIALGDAAAGRRLVAQALELNPHFDALEAQEARALLEAK